MIEGAVVIATVVVAIVLVAVLALQGSVGLSEEEGRPFLQRDVVEPSAGPGVEALHAEERGQVVPAAGSRR